jgi:hypothetical protein
MHFTGFMNFTRQLQNTLCRRGFTGVHVGEKADISVFT